MMGRQWALEMIVLKTGKEEVPSTPFFYTPVDDV